MTTNYTRNSGRGLCALLRMTAFLLSLAGACPAFAVSPDVVISQVYGGGGNSGATYKNDFIELFNRGTSPVSLNGWSVQYASATGTTWQATPLTNVTLQPGQYYLVQEAAGTGGTVSLPTPDATGSIAMSATAGKVALSTSTTALSGGCPTGVRDFVGYGSTATCSETSPTATLSNTTAALRTNSCTDTDNNSADFSVVSPAPRNTSSTPGACSTVQTYTLTTDIAGNGSGSITGVANPYESGATAQITAITGTSSIFTGWSGCSTSTEPTITVTMDADKSCTANFNATSSTFTILHVNDTHARLTPHKMIPPTHATANGPFENVGGAAYLAGKMLQLTATNPNALVIDAGDISEGNPIGDMNGNGSMTQFYTLLSGKLLAQRGRGMDAVVVGNHDVRDISYVNNLIALKNSGVPVISVNVRDKNTHLPYFAPYTVATVNGKKIGIIGYTNDAADIGPTLTNTLEVVTCDWNGGSTNPVAACHLADYVNTLRTTEGVDLVVLAAHIGHSALVVPPTTTTQAPLADAGTVKLPEAVVTGHWHTWAETPAWQPEILNYKSTFTEAGSYMKYIGELQLTDTGKFYSASNHLIHNADITPDPDVQSLVSGLIDQYNAAHPGHPVDEVVGYTADNLLLDNEMRWWSANEYPWSGNNSAGQWICDAMRWKAEQLFGQCDLAIETGGGVRADIPAGPVTYLQVYETFPWNDDTFMRINMTGQQIIDFLKATNMNAGFSSALDVTAYDGVPTSVLFNNAPIDVNHTYTVAINNYMFNNPPAGVTFSSVDSLTNPYLCREGIVDYMRSQHPDQYSPYVVGGPRYHLNTEFSGGYRAVVTMMNDSDTKTTYEDAFLRMLSATPETLARRGTPQVPADLVNADGSINPAHHLAEHELYRSFLGFKAGALKPGDIVETWGKGSFYDGNPEFVDQEGIYGHGVEFRIVGNDPTLAKPTFMTSIGSFWKDQYKNHYVQFLAKKTGANSVADQNGQTLSLMDATGYAVKSLPGSIGDVLHVSGVPTMENYGLRFRCDNAVVSTATLPTATAITSSISPILASTTATPLTLTATTSTFEGIYNLAPVADSQVVSSYPTSNYGTSNNLYVQSSTSGYGNERGWFRFDLSTLPANAIITGANLQLWNWKASGAPLPASVHGGSDDSWSETAITWDTQPNFDVTALDTRTLDPAITGANGSWYQWNVASFVQDKFTANKLVSLVVKPVTENSTDAPPPSYAFDAKEYGSNGPVLQVITQTSTATVSRVDFYYRYSADNSTWGAWTLYATSPAAPFSTSFSYPQGYGYYEFYSRATDSTGITEPIPVAAQATTHYVAAPPYSTTAIVSLSGLSTTYDGSAKAATVVTIPPGLTVSTTYNGSSTLPVDAGTYTVATTVTQPGFTGTASDTMTIDKATATVNLGLLSFTYDSTAKSISPTTIPSGLPLSVTYNGSSTPPTEIGSYEAMATVTDPNYQGSATGTMSIAANATPAPVPALGTWGVMITAAALGGTIIRRRR